MLLVLHCVLLMCLIITVKLLFPGQWVYACVLCYNALHRQCKAKGKFGILGGQGLQMWTFGEGAGPGPSPGTNLFGGIKTPKNAYSGYEFY